MKKILAVLSILCILAPNTYSQAYFPLETGNRWDFSRRESYSEVTTFTDTFSVIVKKDTLMQNGKKYFVLNTQYIGPSNFIRYDSAGICYYIPHKSKEWLVYRWNSGIGERYRADSADSNSPLITLERKETATILGNNSIILLFTYNSLTGHRISLSEKFGPVSYYTAADGIALSYNSAIIGCRISGIVHGNLTSVETSNNNTKGFYLSDNYPNPFNPATTIRYSIPVTSYVELKVFDMLGREVSAPVKEEQAAGEYAVRFDGTSLPSGVYIYSLQADNFRNSKKLLLLK